MRLFLLALLVVAVAVPDASAARRGRAVVRQEKSTYIAPSGATQSYERTVVRGPVGAATDALAEVNAQRAARGLPPFIRDEGLTQAAQSAATFRAERLLFGHVQGGMGDFQFLPSGVTAAAAGCAAYPESYGFMACATYESYRYAGAAVVFGGDGRRYCHLFVR